MKFFNILLNLSLAAGLTNALPTELNAGEADAALLDSVAKRTTGDGRRGSTGDPSLLPNDRCRTDFGNHFIVVGDRDISAAIQAASLWIHPDHTGYAPGRPQWGATPYPHLFANNEGIQWDSSVRSALQPNQPLFEFPILSSGRSYAGGDPGPYRVVVAINRSNPNDNLIYVGGITHVGAANNRFNQAPESC